MANRRRKGGPDAAPGGAPARGPVGPRRPVVPAARSPKAPGRGGNRPDPSLVYATLFGSFPQCDPRTGEELEAPFRAGVIAYPDGGGEAYAVKTTHPRPRSKIAAGIQWLEEQDEIARLGPEEAARLGTSRARARAARSADESARRARSKVRRLVRTYQLSYMVTLTFPGDGVREYDRALRLLQDFLHDHGNIVHRGGFWLGVPELHPGGHGWHWHVLVPSRFSRNELAALWDGWTAYLGRRGMQPSGGARRVRIDVKSWGTACHAARYAAKYVGKTFEKGGVGRNRRRFLSAQGGRVDTMRCGIGSLNTLVDVLSPYESVHVIRSDDTNGGPPIAWAGW